MLPPACRTSWVAVLALLTASPCCCSASCGTPYDAIQSACADAPAISYLWPNHVAEHQNANISVALKNVRSDCVNAQMATTPCAAHHEDVPPLFRCVFTRPGSGAVLSPWLNAQPIVRSTVLPDGTQANARIEVVVSCPLDNVSALEALLQGTEGASDASLVVGVRFRDLDLPYEGSAEGNVVSLPSLVSSPPPARPPGAPPVPPPSPPSYRYWSFQSTRDGTANHICFDAFRFITPDGTSPAPTAISYSSGAQHYGQTSLERVFNKDDDPGGDSRSHWCAWSKPTIDVTFAEPQHFARYKFWPHSSACGNDPQTWNIRASTDGASWTTLATEDHDCPLPNLNGFNWYDL